MITKDTKCPSQVFYDSYVDLYFICTNFGLEIWFSSNDDICKCLIDMKSSWTKYVFWDVNNNKWRKWCKFYSLFLSNNTFGLPVITKDTKCPSLVYYVWFFDLHTGWGKFVLETWFPPNDDIRKCSFGMKNGWTKNAFWEVNNKKWRKLCVCFTFLI
jgi:hypothetical protein